MVSKLSQKVKVDYGGLQGNWSLQGETVVRHVLEGLSPSELKELESSGCLGS